MARTSYAATDTHGTHCRCRPATRSPSDPMLISHSFVHLLPYQFRSACLYPLTSKVQLLLLCRGITCLAVRRRSTTYFLRVLHFVFLLHYDQTILEFNSIRQESRYGKCYHGYYVYDLIESKYYGDMKQSILQEHLYHIDNDHPWRLIQ